MENIKAQIAGELDRCVAFWLNHSHDKEHGWEIASIFKLNPAFQWFLQLPDRQWRGV